MEANNRDPDEPLKTKLMLIWFFFSFLNGESSRKSQGAKLFIWVSIALFQELITKVKNLFLNIDI